MTSGFVIRYNGVMFKKPSLPLAEEWMKKHRLPFMPVIWGISCLIIGGVVLSGLRGYSRAERETARQFNSQQLVLAGQAARGIETDLEEIRRAAFRLAASPEIRDLAEGKGRAGEEAVLARFHESFSGSLRRVLLISADGKMISAHPPGFRTAPETNARLSPLADKAVSEAQAAPLVFLRAGEGDPASGGVAALLALPVTREGRRLGTLGFLLDFTRIGERFLGPLRPGGSGESWMVSREGKWVVHSAQERVGQDVFSAGGERGPRATAERLERILREEMLAGKAGMDEYTASGNREAEGAVRKLIAYAPVGTGGEIGSVAVSASYEEVTAIVRGSFKSSLWLLGVMTGTLLAGTYVGQKINQRRVLAEEKVQWSEAVLKSQARLQALFDGAPDAIIIVDRNYRILTVNKTTLAWYGKPPEAFAGKSCHEVFQELADLCPNCPAQESFATGRPAFRERASLTVGRTKRYLQLFTYPLLDGNGRVAEVVEYVKDVTAERRLQQQVIQSERLAVVGRMSASVAHEIKNPLGTIVLNAELLREELDRFREAEAEEAKSLLAVIRSEIDRLLRVVEEYLQFARLPKTNLEEGSVNEVLADLLLFLREDLAGRKILLREDLAEALPRVQLDPHQLRQALLNVVKNSLEAMPEGGKLTLTTGTREGWVEIRIGDTGRGIPEENWDQVFTPFFSTKHGGTGLGLPITAHIVEEHGGTLHLDSFPDLGTVFTMRLPIPEPRA